MQFTREEMATLVDMLLLAMWATESNVQDEPEAQPALQKYSQLAEKVFATARRSGDVRGLMFEPTQQIHIPTDDYETESFAVHCFDCLRNSVFWEELARRLAERDLSEAAAGNGGPGQDERRAQRLEKEYWERFLVEGIENLRLLAPYPHG